MFSSTTQQVVASNSNRINNNNGRINQGRNKNDIKRPKLEIITIDTDDACSNDHFERYTKEAMVETKQIDAADVNVSPVK